MVSFFSSLRLDAFGHVCCGTEEYKGFSLTMNKRHAAPPAAWVAVVIVLLVSVVPFLVTAVSVVPPEPFEAVELREWLSCAICPEVITNLAIQIQTYIDIKEIEDLKFSEVSYFTRSICDPYTRGGSWVRRVGLVVMRDDPLNQSSTVRLVSGELRDLTQCNRTCITVMQSCQYTSEYLTFYAFETEVLEFFKNQTSLTNETVVSQLQKNYCSEFVSCHKAKNLTEALTTLLNDPNNTLRSEIENAPLVYIEPQDYKNEFVVKQSEVNAIEQYTPVELQKMRAYLERKEKPQVPKNHMLGSHTNGNTGVKDRAFSSRRGEKVVRQDEPHADL